MEDINITEARPEELPAVLQISRETFIETFQEVNTPEDMEKYLTEKLNGPVIKMQLANPESFFFIAWHGEVPIGYLKLNAGQAQTELRDASSLEIERIYVKKAWQHKKVGQLLYEKACDAALRVGKTYLWLGVWEENAKAIRFYEKNGFVAFDRHVFMLGDDKQIDVMMRRELSSLT